MTAGLSLGRKLALAVVFAWFLVGGIGHFVATEFFIAIVPPWVPQARAVVYLSGLLELVGALGLLWPMTRRWAGNGLFLLTLAVSPANVHMWLHPEQFADFSPAFLSARLLLQVLLLVAIVWSTRPARAAT